MCAAVSQIRECTFYNLLKFCPHSNLGMRTFWPVDILAPDILARTLWPADILAPDISAHGHFGPAFISYKMNNDYNSLIQSKKNYLIEMITIHIFCIKHLCL